MAQIKIKCPQCGRNYALTAPDPSVLVNKQFTCKHCGKNELFGKLFVAAGIPISGPHTGGVGAFPPPSADNMHTRIGGMPQSPKTQIGGTSQAEGNGKTQVANNRPIGIITVQQGGKSYRFGQGVYILGRDSSDSRASIKVAADPYMSRQHAKLSATNIGGTPTCLLTCMSQSNPIYINGQEINTGVPTPLRNGDKILLGMTIVTFNLI